jgi:hypothetical protein
MTRSGALTAGLLWTALLPVAACAFPVSYSAKEMNARVVDAETGAPLEGVNVVAHWVLSFGLEGGGMRDLELMEAVTDREGKFHFPAWGPKRVPKDLPSEARMKNQDPEIILFKSGYFPLGVSNEAKGPQPGPGAPVRASEWDGRTLQLKKFAGRPDIYGSIVSGVLTGVTYSGCEWKRIPRMLVALDREAQALQRENVTNNLPTIAKIRTWSQGQGCGSVEEFFREYTK